MSRVLEFVNLDDFLPLAMLIGLLWFVGDQIAMAGPEVRQRARWLTAAAFLAYAIIGIVSWEPTTASEFLELASRSLLAAGLVWGMSLICLPAMASVYELTVGRIMSTNGDWTTHAHTTAEHNDLRRQLAGRERKTREDRERQTRATEAARRNARKTSQQAERERRARCAEARDEAIRFYDEHGSPLQESYPPALFRTQLQSRFFAGITPEQAWQAAQEMISAMLPLIRQGRERVRAEEKENRRRADRARLIRREIAKLEAQIQQLTKSPLSDPEVVGHEVRAIQDQIRTLHEDLQSLEVTEQGETP